MATPVMASTASPSTSTPAAASKAGSKSKQKKIVILRLPPSALAKYPSATPVQPMKPRPSPSMPPTSPYETSKPPTKVLVKEEDTKASSETPLPNDDASSTPSGPAQVNSVKRKGPSPGAGEGSTKKAKLDDKSRAKPGPKRRKGADGETGAAPTSHKTNPKANTGAINANLRALDLTGTKTRKWQKRGLQFTSFTGKTWDVPRWNTNKRGAGGQGFAGDTTSETTRSSEQAKIEPASSVMPSEHGEGVNGITTPSVQPGTGLVSSPAPPPVQDVSLS